MNRLRHICIGIALVGMVTFPAVAQTSFPEFTLTDDQQALSSQDGLAINIQESVKNIKNPLLRDRFTLQHQIILLEHLLKQQSEVKNIAENYRKSGIKFSQDAPRESICDQLPTNILCTLSYPAKSDNQDVIKEAYDKAIEAQKQEVLTIFQEIYADYVAASQQASTAKTTSAITKILPPTDYLSWSDISCRGKECSALIENKNDNLYRQRVKKGDVITQDNKTYKITDINIRGVSLQSGQSTYLLNAKEKTQITGGALATVDPNASMSLPQQPNIDFLDPGSVGDAVNNRFTQFTDNMPVAMPQVPSPQDSAAIAPQGIQDNAPAPVLGPTGLF